MEAGGEEGVREEGGKVRQRDISTKRERERERKREKEKKKIGVGKRATVARISARLQWCKLLPLLSSLVRPAATDRHTKYSPQDSAVPHTWRDTGGGV